MAAMDQDTLQRPPNTRTGSHRGKGSVSQEHCPGPAHDQHADSDVRAKLWVRKLGVMRVMLLNKLSQLGAAYLGHDKVLCHGGGHQQSIVPVGNIAGGS